MLRASPAIIAKVAIEKVQLSTLTTIFFFILSLTDSLFYSLFFLKYYCVEESAKEIGRECVKGEREERENNNN
jgi:hypothetical protein